MQQRYTLLTYLLCLLATGGLTAQSIVVPADLDDIGGNPVTFISDYVDADTTAEGVQQHDTYLLQRGGTYLFNAEKRWEFDVAFVATGDEDLPRPIITRFSETSPDNLPPMYRGFGNLTFDGIYLIMGEEVATAASYENSSIRPQGVGKRFIFNNCIIEKSRQAIARIEGDSSKSYVTNCIIRNIGDYELLQGNGRIIDVRNTFADSVVITNNVIHNILDRLYIGFRQQGNNYFEFSRNTVFNHVGRHGLIQLKNTKESVINDNLFINPSIIGTSPGLANEQINFVDSVTFLFTLDTIVPGASLEMNNNNIHYTEDVLDHYATFDSVSKPPILSPTFIELLGDTTNAYTTVEVELNNVPSRAPIIQYAREAVLFPDSVGITDIMVEPIEREGTDYDEGYLFDFSTFDPCYSEDSPLVTAGTDGIPVGANFLCPYVVSLNNPTINTTLGLTAMPNPAGGSTTLAFSLSQRGQVVLDVFDTNGRRVAQLLAGERPAGTHTVQWSDMSGLAAGMYFANLQTEEGRMFIRIVKN